MLSHGSILQYATISNRPLCILIHSLASNIGHQQLCKGRSPTEKHAGDPQINHINKCDLHLIALDLNSKSRGLGNILSSRPVGYFLLGPRSRALKEISKNLKLSNRGKSMQPAG